MIKLYHGDCRKFLFNEIDADSIDLTVTSPPYDSLRSYNNSSTWGWAEFCGVASGLWRVTKPGGVVVWVVGDATVKGSETGSSFEQALAFKKMRFNLHDTMIWSKPSYPPNDTRQKRYVNCFEYMYVLSKDTPSCCNYIKTKCQTVGETRTGKQRKINGQQREDNFKKRTVNELKPLSNVWTISKVTKKKVHPATFPEQLANDHIISWSNEGDTVFDPFMGSGTTGKMALLNNRKFIGCEIDSEYFQIAKDRIEAVKAETTD